MLAFALHTVYIGVMAKKDTTNRTFRFSERTIERLADLSEKFESTENSVVTRAVLELWERAFPEKARQKELNT